MSSTNGKASASSALLLDDPMARVMGGPRMPVEITIVGAIVLHLALGAGAVGAGLYDEIHTWQRGIRDIVAFRLSQYEVEVVKEPPPPEPEKAPEPTPEKAPEPKELPKDAPPPLPAEAAKIIAAEPNPNDPVDLTGGFVQGSGETYVGGTTSSKGTSKAPVYNPAAANTGVAGGTGTTPAPPPPPPKDDKSRVPGLLGSSDWNDCPFPGEADAEQIDTMKVLIQVQVKPDGSPENVTVVQDPGHGFGREARKCAMRKKYAPGLDANGNPVGGMTKPFRVRFER